MNRLLLAGTAAFALTSGAALAGGLAPVIVQPNSLSFAEACPIIPGALAELRADGYDVQQIAIMGDMVEFRTTSGNIQLDCVPGSLGFVGNEGRRPVIDFGDRGPDDTPVRRPEAPMTPEPPANPPATPGEPNNPGGELPEEPAAPIDTPPVVTPPVDTPPVVTPPVDTPPAQPPVDMPPAQPPVDTPPVVTPPVDTPPVVTPPVDTPPAQPPVVTNPPPVVNNPPPVVDTPPVVTPPTPGNPGNGRQRCTKEFPADNCGHGQNDGMDPDNPNGSAGGDNNQRGGFDFEGPNDDGDSLNRQKIKKICLSLH